MMFGLWFSRTVLPILTFGIPIPLWLIAAALIWVHFDKSSAVRTAVNQAVTELVAGAELEAARAVADAERQRRIFAEGSAAEARRRAAAAEDASRAFAAAHAAAEAEKEQLDDDIDDLLAQAVDAACTVSPDLLDRMRNR